MYLSKFAQSPDTANHILALIKLITMSDLSPNKDLDDFNHSISIGKPNLNIKPTKTVKDGENKKQVEDSLDDIVASYFAECIDENERKLIKEYQKELGIECHNYSAFEVEDLLYTELEEPETLKKVQQQILNDDLMLIDISKKDLAIYLFADKSRQFSILLSAAFYICREKLASLTIQEKKMILFELIGACYCNGNFDEKQKQMLEYICKALDIEEEYVEEFLEVTEKYFAYFSEIDELINE